MIDFEKGRSGPGPLGGEGTTPDPDATGPIRPAVAFRDTFPAAGMTGSGFGGCDLSRA